MTNLFININVNTNEEAVYVLASLLSEISMGTIYECQGPLKNKSGRVVGLMSTDEPPFGDDCTKETP